MLHSVKLLITPLFEVVVGRQTREDVENCVILCTFLLVSSIEIARFASKVIPGGVTILLPIPTIAY